MAVVRARTRVAWFLALQAVTVPSHAAISDPGFTETVFQTLPSGISGIAWPPDGSNRLFVIRKTGTIHVVENGTLVTPPFATLSPIYSRSECGLIGITFDPNFTENGYLYVFVTVSGTEQQIVRYRAEGNQGTDKTVIVAGLPTRGSNHDGGAIGVGPDGKLYWAIGDLGNRTGVDDDLLSLASKVGRANLDGSAPNDNPFFDGDGPNNDYIWARGFRNPFTLTWEPSAERLWVNVTGSAYEQAFVVPAGGHAGWDDYQVNQPNGFIPPVIAYRTNLADSRSIPAAGGAVRQGGIATFRTGTTHRFRPGAKVTISGVADPSFDGAGYIRDVLDDRRFTLIQPGPDASSGGGTVVAPNLGGALTGGTFWDSTGVPPSYRGNFFFGDYNSGRLLRATLNDAGQVTSVDEWGTGIVNAVDMAVGPDGALYYARYTGNIYRAAYDFSSQALVVSALHLRMAEGGSAAFGVRLAMAPSGPVSVTATPTGGDLTVSVSQGATLSFDASNWSVPQIVRLTAAHDDNSVDDRVEIDVSAAGIGSEAVLVRVTDDDAFGMLLSTSSLELDEGSSGSVQVALSEAPPDVLEISVVRSSGDDDVVVTSATPLRFDASNWSVPQTLTLFAQDDDDTTDDVATITLSAPGLVTREIAVIVADDDDSPPVFASVPPLSAVLGAPYTYDAEAAGRPAPSFVLDTAPPGMLIDGASGVVTWTPTALGTESVVIRASNGIAPDAVQAFDIVVSADQPPQCMLTAPQPNSVVSGPNAEFFGDVVDDLTPDRAEFYVDDRLVYTDANPEGHYHLGGTHNLFDTTELEDGPHVLRMVGYDSAGQSCSAEVEVIVSNGSGGEAGAPGNSGGSTQGGTGGTADGSTAGDGTSGTGGAKNAGDAGSGSQGAASGQGGGQEPPGEQAELRPGGGCDCAIGRRSDSRTSWAALGLGLVLLGRRRRSAREPWASH